MQPPRLPAVPAAGSAAGRVDVASDARVVVVVVAVDVGTEMPVT